MFNKTVFDNGVRIVAESIPGALSVSIGIWIRAGSCQETGQENGLAHFIEHMLFKGTSARSARDIAYAIDSVGGVLNAFTSKEYTCIYAKVLSRHLNLAVDLLCDIFFDSQFQPDEIERERNVIVQEINMVNDTPDDYVQDLFNHNFFGNHPLGYNILGDISSVQKFTRDDLNAFYRREFLVPDRIIIAAAGNVDFAALCDEAAPRFASLKPKHCKPAPAPFTPQRSVTCYFRKLEQVHLCMGTSGVGQNDPDRFGLTVLNTVTGGGMSSRLFQEIRELRGLAYAVYSFLMSFYETGVFGLYAGVVHESLSSALPVIHRELRQLREVPVGTTELASAKEQIKGNVILSLESTDSRMSRLVKCEMYHGGYVPIEHLLKKIDAVTAEHVCELARRFFKDSLFTYTFLGPLHEKNLPQGMLSVEQG